MSSMAVSPECAKSMKETLTLCPVMPVVTIGDPAHAVPLARALKNGGARSIEVTLRTDCAMEAISRIAAGAPDIRVGAGTVLSAGDMRRVKEAGAQFAISPGHTDALVEAACDLDFPYLPAASTVSEVMYLRERGFRHLKLFPATVLGGADLLKSIGAPVPDIGFCPTGGISRKNLTEFLALPNVICVGGSWVAPAEAMTAGQWGRIEDLMTDAICAAGDSSLHGTAEPGTPK